MKAYKSVKREKLRNILTEFGIFKNMFKETWGKSRIGRPLLHVFDIQNGLKQGEALASLLLRCALEYAIRKHEYHKERHRRLSRH
jgi:hypothetical protein